MENVIFRKLDFFLTTPYIDEQMSGLLLYPDMIANTLDLSKGAFYAITPANTKDGLYDFETGLKFPQLSEEIQPGVVEVRNLYSSWLPVLCNEYSKKAGGHIILEDFNSNPNYEYVIKNPRNYLIYQDHLIYIIGSDEKLKEVAKYLKYSYSWIYFGMFLSERNKADLVADYQDVSLLAKSVDGFFLEIYDGESLLFWFKEENGELQQMTESFLNSFLISKVNSI